MMKEYITNAGYELLSRMLTGDCNIDYTRIVMGNGTPMESDLKKVTSVANEVVSLDIESVKIETDNTVDITATFTNAEISEAFYFKEKGVYASDGSKEILFAYAYTADPELIPPYTEEFMEKRLKSIMKQLQSVDAPVNIKVKSGIYVPCEDYDRDMIALEETIKKKVDKVEGKGLSTEDYTTSEKRKLKDIEANANNYELPVADERLGGVKTTSNVTKVTPDMIPVPIVKGVPYYQNTEYRLNDMINGLPNLTDTPTDDDCYIAHGGKGADYYRRPLSALWQYIKAKAAEVFQAKGDYAPKTHSHLYAGSEAAGGKANSAKMADKVNWIGVEGRPTALPASDVPDWAKQDTKPAYAWNEIGNKPNAYPPNTHKHAWSEISNPPATYPPSTHGHAWSEITGKPTAYPPTEHTHSNYLTGITSKMVTDALGYTPPKQDTNTWRPVVDNLTSQDADKSLSAKQGKVLQEKIDTINSNLLKWTTVDVNCTAPISNRSPFTYMGTSPEIKGTILAVIPIVDNGNWTVVTNIALIGNAFYIYANGSATLQCKVIYI